MAILVATAIPAFAVTPHFVANDNDPYVPCAIGVGDPLPQVGAVTSMPMTASDGETGVAGQCGVVDVFFFGPGLDQYFAAHAAAASIFVGKVGVLRGYGAAVAETYPTSYGPPFVSAMNILSASATGGAGGFFVDVITPPPTTAAPNAGDATELVVTPVLDVDCSFSTNSLSQATVDISFWKAATYHDGDPASSLDPDFVFTTGGRPSGDCPDASLSPFQFHVTGLTVGEPLAMQVYLSIHPFAQLLASEDQFGSYVSAVDALGTATALVMDTDGNPVTGASGHTYVTVAPLPDLTIPTTTTTMLPPPTTTTTLPGCGGMCGNGTVEAACGEACDCPPTVDPVVGAFGCTGADVMPPQSDCVVCRGCQLLSFCGGVVTTTTTATIPGATTSTVLATTTTTIPPCSGLVGIDRARCQLTTALAQPLCGADVLPKVVDGTVRAKLNAANTALGSLTTATGKKAKKLRKRALADLRAASARAARAAKAKNASKHVSGSCAATIAALASELEQEIASP